ncbi:unnamed protein product [Cyclocybe aegerita]|uniref:Uncharacterized protein n=1 Tax=Cyclocybe aegerita TaxID=1973307 RepID=A0A8S0VU89_CYCAE|nr:unnamed protein product [Cyclocybe aegerita]
MSATIKSFSSLPTNVKLEVTPARFGTINAPYPIGLAEIVAGRDELVNVQERSWSLKTSSVSTSILPGKQQLTQRRKDLEKARLIVEEPREAERVLDFINSTLASSSHCREE